MLRFNAHASSIFVVGRVDLIPQHLQQFYIECQDAMATAIRTIAQGEYPMRDYRTRDKIQVLMEAIYSSRPQPRKYGSDFDLPSLGVILLSIDEADPIGALGIEWDFNRSFYIVADASPKFNIPSPMMLSRDEVFYIKQVDIVGVSRES